MQTQHLHPTETVAKTVLTATTKSWLIRSITHRVRKAVAVSHEPQTKARIPLPGTAQLFFSQQVIRQVTITAIKKAYTKTA